MHGDLVKFAFSLVSLLIECLVTQKGLGLYRSLVLYCIRLQQIVLTSFYYLFI